MTGLDKILGQINLDADNTCTVIESRCNNDCDNIISDALSTAESIKKDAQTKALKTYSEIIKRAKSSADLEERRILLSARQALISKMINNSVEHLVNLPDDEYFSVLYKMLLRYSIEGEGHICLNDRDIKRLPENFEDNVSSVSKGKLKLSDNTANIVGGFVLKYGNIDINCSFESLYQDNSEEISDVVASLLFG